MPKVSCILPITGDQKINDSLESVKSQTYNNIEILTPRFETLGGALNNGLREASGDIIAIISPGCQWVSDKLETQVQYLLDQPQILISLGFSHYSPIDINEFPSTREELLVYMHTKENPFLDSTLVFKRQLLDKIGDFKYGLSPMCIFEFLLRGLTVSDILIIDGSLCSTKDIQRKDFSKALIDHEYNLSIYKSIKNMAPKLFQDCFGEFFRGNLSEITPNIPCEKAMILMDLKNPFAVREFTDMFEIPENNNYFENVCGFSLTDFYRENLNPILFDTSYYDLCIKLNGIIDSLYKGRD